MHQCATVPSDVHLMSAAKGSKDDKSEGDTEGDVASEDDEGLSSDESYVKVIVDV